MGLVWLHITDQQTDPTGSDLRRLVGPCGVAKRAPEGASLVLGYPEETGAWARREPQLHAQFACPEAEAGSIAGHRHSGEDH